MRRTKKQKPVFHPARNLSRNSCKRIRKKVIKRRVEMDNRYRYPYLFQSEAALRQYAAAMARSQVGQKGWKQPDNGKQFVARPESGPMLRSRRRPPKPLKARIRKLWA